MLKPELSITDNEPEVGVLIAQRVSRLHVCTYECRTRGLMHVRLRSVLLNTHTHACAHAGIEHPLFYQEHDLRMLRSNR